MDLGALLPSLRSDVGEGWVSSADWHAKFGHSSVVSAMYKLRAKAEPTFGSGKKVVAEDLCGSCFV